MLSSPTWLSIATAIAACKSADQPPTGNEPARVKFVDELVPTDHDRALHVRGRVERPFSVAGSGAERVIVFGLRHGEKHLRVMATGVLPVDFRDNADAAVVGRWLEPAFAAPIEAARGLSEQGEIFDADSVWVIRPY